MHNEQCAVYSSKQLSGKQLSGLQAGEYSCMRANMHILPVYALKFELLKFSAALETQGGQIQHLWVRPLCF